MGGGIDTDCGMLLFISWLHHNGENGKSDLTQSLSVCFRDFTSPTNVNTKTNKRVNSESKSFFIYLFFNFRRTKINPDVEWILYCCNITLLFFPIVTAPHMLWWSCYSLQFNFIYVTSFMIVCWRLPETQSLRPGTCNGGRENTPFNSSWAGPGFKVNTIIIII